MLLVDHSRRVMMTSIIVGLMLVAVAMAIPHKDCGLNIQVHSGKQDCKVYLENGLTMDKLKELNPGIDCSQPLPVQSEVCVSGKSVFDDRAMQENTTFTKFLDAASKILSTKSRSQGNRKTFDRVLYDQLRKIDEEMKNPRTKREAKTAAELRKFSLLGVESSIDSLKALSDSDQSFGVLEKAYNDQRRRICEQLDEVRRESKYGKCVCDEEQPFIRCQAILLRKNHQNDPAEIETPTDEFFAQMNAALPKLNHHARSKKKPLSFDRFMETLTKGCPNMECLDQACFSADVCKPTPALVISICTTIEGCISTLNQAQNLGLTVDAFKNDKIAGKVGICLTGFKEMFSWLGIEKCFASIGMEYYYLRNQIELFIQVALLVVKAKANVKVQAVESPFKEYVRYKGTMGNFCAHTDHKCEDYCAFKPGDVGYGYTVEVWWFGWRQVKAGNSPSKSCPA